MAALNSTSGASTNAGHNIITDSTQEIEDEYINNDLFVLESGTFATLALATSLRKVQVTDSGNGYSKLPTLTITSTSGTSGKLIANTTDIGRTNSIEIKDGGFALSSSKGTSISAPSAACENERFNRQYTSYSWR